MDTIKLCVVVTLIEDIRAAHEKLSPLNVRANLASMKSIEVLESELSTHAAHLVIVH